MATPCCRPPPARRPLTHHTQRWHTICPAAHTTLLLPYPVTFLPALPLPPQRAPSHVAPAPMGAAQSTSWRDFSRDCAAEQLKRRHGVVFTRHGGC